jgi:hypothetical protein
MGQETHGVDLLPIVVDRSDKAKIVGDIEHGDGTFAFDHDLVCVRKSLSGLGEILPASQSSDPAPMIERCARFRVDAFCFFEKLPRDDSHEGMSDSGQKGHIVKPSSD